MQQSSVGFKSKGITLEGIVSTPRSAEGSSPGAVLYHPHPLFGGNMYNAVVTALVRALEEAGIASLRFNFRGVGNSSGEFTGGKSEGADIISIIEFLFTHTLVDGSRIGIFGYSFGAWMAMQLLMRRPEIDRFIIVAPPADSKDFNFLAPCPSSGLFIHGDRDEVASHDTTKILSEKLQKQKLFPSDRQALQIILCNNLYVHRYLLPHLPS